MKDTLGDMPHVIVDHDNEGDVYVEPLSGKRLHPDGTPADMKTPRQLQILHDMRRYIGASPSRPSGEAKRNPSSRSSSPSSRDHKPVVYSTAVQVVNIPNTQAESKETNDEYAADDKVGIVERAMAKESPSASSGGSSRAIHGRSRAPRTNEDWFQWSQQNRIPSPHGGLSDPHSHGVGSFPDVDNIVLEDIEGSDDDDEEKSDSTYEPSEGSDDESDDESDDDDYVYDAEGDRFVANQGNSLYSRTSSSLQQDSVRSDDVSEDTYTANKTGMYPYGSFNQAGSSRDEYNQQRNLQNIYPGASIRVRPDGNVESVASLDNIDDRDIYSDTNSSDEDEVDDDDNSAEHLADVKQFISDLRASRGITDGDISLLNQALHEIEEKETKIGSGSWGNRK